MPVFNEPHTLRVALERVRGVILPSGWSLATILIDDGSDSETMAAISALSQDGTHGLDCHRHNANRGKGAALQTGFARAIARSRDDGDAVVIQDADLEYDPNDFIALISALSTVPPQNAVFGNRWHAPTSGRGWTGRIHRFGNRVLTLASNLATGLSVSDMECCYKVIPITVLRNILPSLTEERFGIEPQIAAALARFRVPVTEIPISYAPRSFSQGKKIGPRDGIRAFWVIALAVFRK